MPDAGGMQSECRVDKGSSVVLLILFAILTSSSLLNPVPGQLWEQVADEVEETVGHVVRGTKTW